MSRLFEKDDTQEKVNDLIRIGEVTAIDVANVTCRVTFDDDDGITSFDLPVIQRNTLKNHDYAMPDIGEDVICIFLGSGMEEGFVLGSIYAGEVTPPESNGDKRTVVFADDTRVSYDRAAHELTITIGSTSIVANRQDVSVDTPANINLKAGAKVDVTAPLIQLNGAIVTNSESGGSGTVSMRGNVSVDGNINTTGDNVASGVSLVNHVHTGDSGGTTSKPN